MDWDWIGLDYRELFALGFYRGTLFSLLLECMHREKVPIHTGIEVVDIESSSSSDTTNKQGMFTASSSLLLLPSGILLTSMDRWIDRWMDGSI